MKPAYDPCLDHQNSKVPGPVPRQGSVAFSCTAACQNWYRPLPLKLSNWLPRLWLGEPPPCPLNWSHLSPAFPTRPPATAMAPSEATAITSATAALSRGILSQRGLSPYRT